MKHHFVGFNGKRYYVLSCDHCHRADLPPDPDSRRVVERLKGRWLCGECWDYERDLSAQSALFICATCGCRRIAAMCPTCIGDTTT